ncbi:hypothetical protein Tco_0912492 [Tanacetum coccineum]
MSLEVHACEITRLSLQGSDCRSGEVSDLHRIGLRVRSDLVRYFVWCLSVAIHAPVSGSSLMAQYPSYTESTISGDRDPIRAKSKNEAIRVDHIVHWYTLTIAGAEVKLEVVCERLYTIIDIGALGWLCLIIFRRRARYVHEVLGRRKRLLVAVADNGCLENLLLCQLNVTFS